MNDISVFSYGVIPRKCDRAKAYLYFKGWASRFFEFNRARKEDDLVRVVLLASLTTATLKDPLSFWICAVRPLGTTSNIRILQGFSRSTMSLWKG